MTLGLTDDETVFHGVRPGDVLAILPAPGWVAVYFPKEGAVPPVFTIPLLCWAIFVGRDGDRFLDAITEPLPDDGRMVFVGPPASEGGNFVCFAKAAEVEADPARFAALAAATRDRMALAEAAGRRQRGEDR